MSGKRAKDGSKRAGIGKQIFYAMLVVALVSIMLLGGTVYAISLNTIERNYHNSHVYDLQVSESIINLQLEYIVELGRSLLEDKTFVNAMKSETSDTGYFTSVNQLTIDKTFSDLAAMDVLIDGMVAITDDGNWRYFSKRSSLSGAANHFYKDGGLLEQPWLEKARQARGREVFFGCNVMVPDTETDDISYVKQLIDPSNGEEFGFLVVNIRKKLLERAFGRESEGYDTNRYIVADTQSKNPMIYINEDEGGADMLESYLAGGTDMYLFSDRQNSLTGWTLINSIKKSELSRDSVYIGGAIVFTCLVLILLSMIFARRVSLNITKPLSMLEKTISDVSGGTRHIDTEFDDSEIGLIGRKFKEMVNNNLELRERLLDSELKEKEAELLLLQAQINPHFLYNTLDSLYFMAVIDGDDDIAEMVMALSNTFKLSLNKGDKLITVQNEIMRMQEYMKIQNKRYNNRFDFTLDIQDGMENCKILTFILQPFVENAMYHGLEAKIGRGCISVKGTNSNGKLKFVIKDNGVGLEDMSKLDNGYGIKNVRERIRLFYGEDYGVGFVSAPHRGTEVTIEIPVISEGDDA